MIRPRGGPGRPVAGMMAPEMEPTLDNPRNPGRGYGRGVADSHPGPDDATRERGLPAPRISESVRLPAVDAESYAGYGAPDADFRTGELPTVSPWAAAPPGDFRTGELPATDFDTGATPAADTWAGSVNFRTGPTPTVSSRTGRTHTVSSRTGPTRAVESSTGARAVVPGSGEFPAAGSRSGGHRSVPPRAPRNGSTVGRPRPGRLQLVAVLGLLVGSAAMLTSAALSQTTGTEVPVLSTLAAAPIPPAERPLAERPPPPSTPGTCLSWQRDDAADAVVVNCAGPHLFEQAGPVQLTQFGPDAPLPDNASFRQLVNDRCTKVVTDYLHGHYDPDGAFRAGALKPSSKAWFDGDRSMRCGLQRFSRSGALYPITGTVAGQDQSDVRPAGSCLGIDGKFIGDPVSCTQPHAVQSVGSVDLGQKFTKYPKVSDQDSYLQPQCSKLASSYAGGDQALAGKNLSVMWDNLGEDSWNAGTRRVACNLAAQLPDHSGFAPIIGDAKGKVTVGSQPAPPAPQTSSPGAPADHGPVPAPDQPANGGGDVNPAQRPELPSPSSELPHAPKLPQLPNPFADKDGKPPPNPLGGDNGKPPPNPLGGGDNGKPLLGGPSDNKDNGGL